jgi:hypothetical protein
MKPSRQRTPVSTHTHRQTQHMPASKQALAHCCKRNQCPAAAKRQSTGPCTATPNSRVRGVALDATTHAAGTHAEHCRARHNSSREAAATASP